MIHYLTIIFFCLLNCFCFSNKLNPDTNKSNFSPADIHIQIDSVMDSYAAQGFSGTVLFVKENKILFDKSYGFANDSDKIINNSQTSFNVASISKIFTTAAILKLESLGKLNTSDLINKYVGELPGEKNRATIHHLLCHTAGLVKRGSSLDYNSREKLIATVKDAAMESIPGKEFRYTNLGFSLLAAIVEIASGMPYEAFLATYIINPAGLFKVGHAWEKISHAVPVATGYNNRGIAEPVDIASWGDRGASSHVMNPRELYVWIKALGDGKIINTKQVSKMLFDYSPGNESYAFHKEVTNANVKTFWKGGGHPGFESQLLWYPEKETMLIFFTNKNIGLRKSIFSDLRKIIENLL